MNNQHHHAALMLCVERAKTRFEAAEIKEFAAIRSGKLTPKRREALEQATTQALEEFTALTNAADAFAETLDQLQRLQKEETPAPTDNPFKAHSYPSDNGEIQTYHYAADDRLRALANFDKQQCEAALRLPNLQQVVSKALERRLRKLTREEAEVC